MAVTKVFRIELSGGRDVQKDVQAIKKEMTSFQRSTKAAKAELALLLAGGGDQAAVQALVQKIAQLETRMAALGRQRQSLEKDAKAQAQAEKLLAEAKVKEAQASKLQEQANAARIKSQIAQEKELDRQIALEQKEQRELEKKKRILDALPGSYNAIRNALNQLRPQIQSGNEASLINFGGRQISFQQAIAEFKRLSAVEQDFRRQFAKDGLLVGEYTSGIVQAFNQLKIDDIIRNQVNGARQQLSTLETKSKELVVAYRQAQQSGSADLNKLEKEIHDNVTETQRLRQAIKQTETQLKGVGDIGSQVTSALDRNFKSLKNSAAQFVLAYVGFQAVFSGLRTGVDNAKDLSDQTTELEILLGKAEGGVAGLVGQLGKLNTRTKLAVLEDIAAISSRAGVAEKNLLGVTKAVDIIKTAFGKDFGDIETGTETLVKLINIFFEDGEVTEDRILKIGNAIRHIANESVASVPFINDFAGRMAGVRQVANVTLPQIIGLGAGFEEFKQSTEVSSTVLVKLIPQLARDLDKFAKVAGLTKDEFKKLLADNPIEALLKVSEGLVESGDIEEFAKDLKDVGVEAGRATTIIATLGGKADIFRQRIVSANGAIQSTDAITDAFNRKNENLAATLDKISKKFADAAGGKAFQTTLLAIGTAITFLLNNIPALLVLGGLLAVNWAAQNTQLILLRAQVLGYNLAIGASYVGLGLLTVVQTAYNAVLFITNGALTLATRALAFFGITIKATTGPLGVILTLAGLLATAFAAFGRKIEGARRELSEHIRLQRISNEISRAASQSISEQVSKLDGWIAVIKSATTSADTKRKAIENLIKLNPAFRDALQGQTIDLQKLDTIYGKITKSIQAKARAEAAATLSAQKQQKVTQIAALRQSLEIEVAQARNQTVTTIELTDQEIELLKQSDLRETGAIVSFLGNRVQIFTSRFDQVKKFLDQRETEAINVYKDYLTAQAQAQEELTKLENEVANQQAANAETVSKTFEIDIAKLKAQIEELDKQIENFQGSRADLQKLITERTRLQKQLDALLGKSKPEKSSRLTGQQKDDFKDIDAIRDRLLAEQKKLFLDLEIDEKTYLQNVLRINTNAIDKKLALIKGKNAEERKIIAQLDLEKVNQQRETNQKLFEIDNKQLEFSLRNQRLSAQQQLALTQTNPDLSNTGAIQAKEDFYNNLLQAQAIFNQQQIALEKQYGIQSIENEQKRKEAIETINKELLELLLQLPDARQKDIQAAQDRQLAEFRRRVAEQTIAILETNDSYTKKARKLAELESKATRDRLASEAAAAKISLDQAKKDREARLISEDEYLKKLTEYKEKEAALYQFTTNEQVSATRRFILALKELKDSFKENILGIKTYSDDAAGEQEKVVDAVTRTADIVNSTINAAIDNYFKNREAQIEQEKQNQLDFLDREKERVLATAQSEAEREAIERQFDKKRKTVEKRAAEEKKQNALKQAAIDFAVAVIKTFAQFGFPLGLIPVAALTFAYAVQRAQINKQQFEQGGQPGEVPTRGGKFGGRPHSKGGTDFVYQDRTYNAEVGELSVIRTKNAPKNRKYSITGTHTQIASGLNQLGGGVSFASGATIRKFDTGGQLGATLRPPTFNNGFNSAAVNNNQVSNDMTELKQLVADVARVVYASDQKDVVLNPNKVTRAQEQKRKDISVATI